MRRAAFSLTELLVVISILILLVSFSSVAYYEKSDKDLLARESEDMVLWFYSVMTLANDEGSSFKLYVTQRESGEYELRAVYDGESYRSAKNIYTSSRVNIRNEGGSGIMTYNGKWQTMSPGLSLSIRSKKTGGGRLFLTVSVYGLVEIKHKLS